MAERRIGPPNPLFTADETRTIGGRGVAGGAFQVQNIGMLAITEQARSMAMWFPSRHVEQVRVAQSISAAQHLGGTVASILCVMAIMLAVQARSGFGWAALAWQLCMAALAVAVAVDSRSTSTSVGQSEPASWNARRVTVFAVLYGAGWAVGLAGWAPASGSELAALVVAVSLTHTAYAAAECHFAPTAVVAFSLPVLAASAFVVAVSFAPESATVGLALIALHSLGTFWFLRRNWDRYVRSIEADADKTRLADMLRQQKELAEKAVQLKTRFLAAASHDLRQPMHAISLYLGGLSEIDLPERASRAVRDARECAHDMNDMFRSLLDIARLDAQQAVPNLGVFSVGSMLARLEKEFAPLAHSRDVSLKVRQRADHAYSDPVMVERIAQNFVSNAVRHAPGGRVLVTCRSLGRTVRLAVHDNGRGIPADQQQAIFDEFRQLDAAPDPHHAGGLGLGLAIVRRLAQTLRVPIIVRSTPGRGSMFAVDLPLVHVAAQRAGPVRTARSLHGKLVLLIDDELPILHATSFILEEAGCSVISARSGREAMDSMATSSRIPDAIVCDYELNDDRKGPALITALREEFNSDIPALLVTGHTGGGTAERLARELRLPLLYKPLESTSLTDSLGTLLSTEEH